MTPKGKAKELIKKYSKGKDEYGWSLCEFDSCAKQCAIIAVDEIIKANPNSNPFNTDVVSTMKYWNEVKHELEKL
jgi:hypothetical protein